MDTREFFESNGYVVCRNIVSTELIDKVLDLYKQQVVPSKESFFRQMTNKYEQNEFNEFGYVKQDFLDVHNYKNFPEFSASVKEILCSDEVQNTLKKITGSDSFKMMQSLLFDLNRETVPHYDSYYLDTVPSGQAVAIWIALEDINEKAGRFYVLPKSTDVDLHSDVPDLAHWGWLARMQQYFESHRDKIDVPVMNKGDLILWNARLVHGALPILDPSFSRKSMTAHFLPLESEYSNLFASKKFLECETYKGVQIYSATVATKSEWEVRQMEVAH